MKTMLVALPTAERDEGGALANKGLRARSSNYKLLRYSVQS